MSLAICPRCHTILVASKEAPRTHRCGTCRGLFARAAEREETTEMSSGVESVNPPAIDRDQPSVSCPHCLTPMQPEGKSHRFKCPRCDSLWVDAASPQQEATIEAGSEERTKPVSSSVNTNESESSSFVKNLLYGASLPERFLRSGVGLTAGAAKELASVLVPQAFQSSKSYEVAIDNALTFLTETIGGVTDSSQPDEKAEAEAGEQMARKAVGNFVDLAGLAMLHVSPMWALAAVSDIAYGSRTYVREVAAELKKQGVIDDTSTIHRMDDILDAIQQSSGNAASTFDRPPLSVDELRQSLEQTRADLEGVDLTTLLPETEVRRLWTEMQAAASQEDVSLLGVSSAITMQMLEEARTVSTGTLTGIRVAGGLLNRNVIGHYSDALERIKADGFYETVAQSYQPYVDAVWSNFSEDRKTWTEQLLDPDNLTSTVNKLFRFLDGDDET